MVVVVVVVVCGCCLFGLVVVGNDGRCFLVGEGGRKVIRMGRGY